jgi:hypothetical protein
MLPWVRAAFVERLATWKVCESVSNSAQGKSKSAFTGGAVWAELKADSSLKEIIEVIRQFVMPVVDAILTENADNKVWQPGEPWEKDRKL